jgi:hypothetical protein
MEVNMRLITVLIFFMIFAAAPFAGAATENSQDSYEKSFQEFGKKLDEAHAKGQKLGQDAKKEWQELKAKTEKTTEQAAAASKEKREDWGHRLQGAVSEVGQGFRKAWNKLKGEK